MAEALSVVMDLVSCLPEMLFLFSQILQQSDERYLLELIDTSEANKSNHEFSSTRSN